MRTATFRGRLSAILDAATHGKVDACHFGAMRVAVPFRQRNPMTHAIRIHQTGGPEVLSWDDVEVGRPGPGEARIRQTAIGLNFIDTYHRTGLYPLPAPRRDRLRGGRRRRRRSGPASRT